MDAGAAHQQKTAGVAGGFWCAVRLFGAYARLPLQPPVRGENQK
jgi:hypothetical protein